MSDVDAARAQLAEAFARKMRADEAWKLASDEATAAGKACRAAEAALDRARYAAEYDRTHPQLFGDEHQADNAGHEPPGAAMTEAANASTAYGARVTGRHEPDPDPGQSAYDVCRACGRAIREAPELGAWVTTVSRNPECYGRAA